MLLFRWKKSVTLRVTLHLLPLVADDTDTYEIIRYNRNSSDGVANRPLLKNSPTPTGNKEGDNWL